VEVFVKEHSNTHFLISKIQGENLYVLLLRDTGEHGSFSLPVSPSTIGKILFEDED
jgi:hypothetical protein